MAVSWETDCVELVRVLINDAETPYTYSDERLCRTLVVAAFQLLQEATFTQTFTVDISQRLISPDPTDRDGGTNDETFVNLLCLKAACIIDNGAAIIAAQKAFAIKDMVTQVDLRDVGKHTLSLLKEGYCAQYKQALDDYLVGDGSTSAAVMGPFRILARNFGMTSLMSPRRVY